MTDEEAESYARSYFAGWKDDGGHAFTFDQIHTLGMNRKHIVELVKYAIEADREMMAKRFGDARDAWYLPKGKPYEHANGRWCAFDQVVDHLRYGEPLTLPSKEMP